MPVQPIEPASLDTQYSTIHKVITNDQLYTTIHKLTRNTHADGISYKDDVGDNEDDDYAKDDDDYAKDDDDDDDKDDDDDFPLLMQHTLPQSPSRRKTQNRSMARSVPGTLDR